jgi:hypothetical protein
MASAKYILALAVLVLALPGHAATLRYDYSGRCNANCSLIGLTEADYVSGHFVIEDTNLPSASNPAEVWLLASELLDFNFIFGPEVFSFGDVIPTANLIFVWEASPEFASFQNGQPQVAENQNGMEVSFWYQNGSFNAQLSTGAGSVVAGSTGWTISPVPVPVPATIWLFTSGLAFLGFLTRKGRRKTRAA